MSLKWYAKHGIGHFLWKSLVFLSCSTPGMIRRARPDSRPVKVLMLICVSGQL